MLCVVDILVKHGPLTYCLPCMHTSQKAWETERERERKAICNVAFLAEKFCGVEDCLKCSEASSSVCEECQNGYVLSREDGLCSTKTGPTFSTGTSERGDRADDEGESGNESGLSDFVIAGL